MSLSLFNEYAGEFDHQLKDLKVTVSDEKVFGGFIKAYEDPPEYVKIQELLKKMEIESMNFMESEDYA